MPSGKVRAEEGSGGPPGGGGVRVSAPRESCRGGGARQSLRPCVGVREAGVPARAARAALRARFLPSSANRHRKPSLGRVLWGRGWPLARFYLSLGGKTLRGRRRDFAVCRPATARGAIVLASPAGVLEPPVHLHRDAVRSHHRTGHRARGARDPRARGGVSVPALESRSRQTSFRS